MEMQEHPTRFIWTFGNHEPLNMYRRIGKKSTGGVPGGAHWLEKWHHWYDSEECAETMANLGLNVLHCRCYKGLGWMEEKKDFPNVVSFARACRKRGIKVLAYVQYSSLYPEIMRREIPNLIDWCQLDQNGQPQTYLDSYWRWIPCPNRPGFLEYMDGILGRIVESGEFDGVMFDNTLNFPCYCPECREKFSRRLEERGFDFLDPKYVILPPSDKTREMIGSQSEIMDPVIIEYIRFRRDTIKGAFARFRQRIKSMDPECVISANIPLMPRRQNLVYYNTPTMDLAPLMDVVLSQTGNQPEWNGSDGVISQQHEIKFANALHLTSVPLNDNDAGGSVFSGGSYSGPLFESLFGGTTPVDRIIMKPLPGGALNTAKMESRKPVLERLRFLSKTYEEVLELPEYAPIGLLYSEDSCTLSQKAIEAYYRCETSLLANHLPYRMIAVKEDQINQAELNECSVLILPNANCLSDALVEILKNWDGRLILAGDENGWNDENYRQRAELPFAGKETIEIPQHKIINLNWKVNLQIVPDNWSELFADVSVVRLNLSPAAHCVIKRNAAGKIVALLISAPTAISKGEALIPKEFQANTYKFVTLTGEEPAVFHGNTLKLPAFEGMLMVIAL
ncbi:MAG: hypothetical protein IJJ26_07380 [Victivallales bacterium]|nr:hypothetical protein [Victivallales bacterium]